MKKTGTTRSKRKPTARRVVRTTGRTGKLSIQEIREAVLAVSGKKSS